MSEPIVLQGKEDIAVDSTKVGISYSGGGPLLVIELGCARAFVKKGIVPSVITGVSAGALAGAAHALDPVTGKGIDMAADLLPHLSQNFLGLTIPHVVGNLVMQLGQPKGLGDNAPAKGLIEKGLLQDFKLANATIGDFEPMGRPKLMVAASNRIDGTSVWFPDETPLADALIASSAIPGVFPWREMNVGGQLLTLVDGGVITNQPLSNLVLNGGGTIYACAVGYAGGVLPAPTNALDNALPCIQMMTHQCTKLEEAYVSLKLGEKGRVYHIHPEIKTQITSFDFTADSVAAIMDEACTLTLDWLTKLGVGAQEATASASPS
jgi:predicted acylesterase/phospholipase RssA